MKKLLLTLLSAVALTAIAQQKTVAVLDPICRDNSVNGFYQQIVRGAMESAVTASNEYEAYDRSAFDQIQKEQAFQRTGAVSDSQIKQMGEMAGVDYILVSEVTAYEGYLSSIVKILNVTTGKYDRSIDDLMPLSPESVQGKCKEMASSLFAVKVFSDPRTYNNARSNPSSSNTTELYRKDPTWKSNPTITDDCVINVSIMHEAVKEKKYADAYRPWLSVYENCPNANKTVYADGAKILKWKWEHATNDAEKNKYAEKLLELYDKRIFYFGNDTKYPTAYILGEKGIAFKDLYGEDRLEEAYVCLQKCVQQLGHKSKITVLVYLFETSYGLYKREPDNKVKQLIADYELVRKHLSTMAADASFKNAEIAGKQVQYVDNLFAISGAAECSTVDKIFEPILMESTNDLDALQRIIMSYMRIRCTNSDIFLRAFEAAERLEKN